MPHPVPPWSQDVESCLNPFGCACFQSVPGLPTRSSTCSLGLSSAQPAPLNPIFGSLWFIPVGSTALEHKAILWVYGNYTSLLFLSTRPLGVGEDSPCECGQVPLFPWLITVFAKEARTHTPGWSPGIGSAGNKSLRNSSRKGRSVATVWAADPCHLFPTAELWWLLQLRSTSRDSSAHRPSQIADRPLDQAASNWRKEERCIYIHACILTHTQWEIKFEISFVSAW